MAEDLNLQPSQIPKISEDSVETQLARVNTLVNSVKKRIQKTSEAGGFAHSTSATNEPGNNKDLAQIPRKHRGLPSGYEGIKAVSKQVTLDQSQIPWLDHQEKVNLVSAKLRGNYSINEFYYGSLIRGRELTNAAQKLSDHARHITDNLMFSHLPSFLGENNTQTASELKNQITNQRIYYFKNHGGQRVYFLRSDGLLDKPVIIRVAVCDKADQIKVLGILTDQPHSMIKKLGGV